MEEEHKNKIRRKKHKNMKYLIKMKQWRKKRKISAERRRSYSVVRRKGKKNVTRRGEQNGKF